VLMIFTSLPYHACVTLPLLALSVPFQAFLPLATASLLISVGVCVVAALQAELPAKQHRPWSRALVALLFFLQPIIRGGARYQSRLDFGTKVRREKMDAELQPQGWEILETFFWSRKGIDRYTFLDRVFKKLASEKWRNKPDTGWENHDAEIFSGNWSVLRLTTVSEDLGHNKRFLRCRIKAQWSLLARTFLGALAVTELLLIAIFSSEQPWIWMGLFVIPLVIWWFQFEKWEQQNLLAGRLEQAAKDLGLEKYEHRKLPITESKRDLQLEAASS
jgi:hypothetical protein